MRTGIIFVALLGILSCISVKAQSTSEINTSLPLICMNQTASTQIVSQSIISEIQSLKQQIAHNEEQFMLLMSEENPDMNKLYKNIDDSHNLHYLLTKFRLQMIKIALFNK